MIIASIVNFGEIPINQNIIDPMIGLKYIKKVQSFQMLLLKHLIRKLPFIALSSLQDLLWCKGCKRERLTTSKEAKTRAIMDA